MPKNTTSRLQPLDAGIIQNFKVKYRKLLLKFVISRVNDKKTASEIVKEVDVLEAIRCVKEAWNQVDEETIRKCFRKCGLIPAVCEEIESNDQIDTEFEELLRRIDSDASSADYIGEDNMVPFCREPIDLSKEEWRSLIRNEVLSRVLSTKLTKMQSQWRKLLGSIVTAKKSVWMLSRRNQRLRHCLKLSRCLMI